MSGRDTNREYADFVASLVAAGKRERADDATKMRAFDRVSAALDEGNGLVAKVSNAVEAVEESDESRWSQRLPNVRFAKSWSARSFGFASAALGTLLAVSLVGGGMFIKRQSDEKEAASAAASAQLAETQKQLDSLNAELAAQNASVDAAQAALSNAKDESAKQAAAAQLLAAQTAVQKTKSTFAAASRAAKAGQSDFQGVRPPRQAAPCTCSKLDPLCGCIQ